LPHFIAPRARHASCDAAWRWAVFVSAEHRTRILACTDLGQLDRWLHGAVTAESAGDLFGP
jgi:hypothetical protein